MPYVNQEKQKEAQRKHYLINKEKYSQRSREYKQKNIDYVRELKESTPCHDCGKKYPYAVMDFHHLNSDDKEFEINHMLRNTYSMKKILVEMEKCIILCANCHRIRTYRKTSPTPLQRG